MDNTNTHGTWKTIRLHCGDGRVQEAALKYGEEAGGFSDVVSLPGGVKQFLENPARQQEVLDDMRIYVRLHNPPAILVLQHEDCGAYGGSKALHGGAEELEFQERELQKAVPILQREFPGLQIIPGFIGLDGKVIVFSF